MDADNHIYIQIARAIRECDAYLKLADAYSAVEVRNAVRSVMRDNPDLFWFAHQYNYDENKSAIYFKYIFSTDVVAGIQGCIKDVIDNDFCLDYVKSLSRREQIVYVYKWLVQYCNYNLNSAYNQGIYSVFICRNSVCTGYAKAAQYLFALLGIESRLVFGQLNNDIDSGRHCWNIVLVDNQWYHFDACFGDIVLDDIALKSGVEKLVNIGGINYNFLCTSTSEIWKTRSIETVELLPVCNASWSIQQITSLADIEIKRRNDHRGVMLSSKGSFSDVYLCTADKNVVLKCFSEPIDTEKIWAEYRFADRLKNCKHILHLVDTYTDVDSGIIAIEQAVPLIDIIMSPYSSFSLRDALYMARDVSYAVNECYEYNIYYKDIHLNNIYKCRDGIYKISDFGSCGWDFQTEALSISKPVEASRWFMSPETYKTGAFSIESAIYSITLVLYFLLNDFNLPLAHIYRSELALQKRCDGELISPLSLYFNSLINEKINAFLLKGLSYNISNRFQGIAEFVKGVDDILLALDNQDFILHFSEHKLNDSLFNFTLHSCKTVSLSAVVEGEVVCPKCGWNYTAMIEQGLAQQLLLLPKENGASGGVALVKSKTDFLRCPNCHFAITADEAFVNNSLSLNFENHWSHLDRYSETTKAYEDISQVDRYCCTCGYATMSDAATYEPVFYDKENTRKKSFWQRILKGKHCDTIYSSIYAPAEVKKKSHLLTQVYFHLFEETATVLSLAKGADINAQRRCYVPISLKLKDGDKLDVEFNVYGGRCLMSERKTLVWQGSMTHCYFDYFVPEDIDVIELSCEANIYVNGAMIGDMRFLTQIVEAPRNINPHITSRYFSRIFISYAHQDARQIKLLALAYKAQGVDYFFDRDSLAPGDVYEEKIFDYIDSADLFVLCWSKNAEASDYVSKEKGYALSRAYPQTSYNNATLKICPISIEPRAELPVDMKGIYNFEVI